MSLPCAITDQTISWKGKAMRRSEFILYTYVPSLPIEDHHLVIDLPWVVVSKPIVDHVPYEHISIFDLPMFFIPYRACILSCTICFNF